MAITVAEKPKKIRIGDLLVSNRVISQEQLEIALGEQKKSGRKLGKVLIEKQRLLQIRDFLFDNTNVLAKSDEETQLRNKMTENAAEQIVRRIVSVLSAKA